MNAIILLLTIVQGEVTITARAAPFKTVTECVKAGERAVSVAKFFGADGTFTCRQEVQLTEGSQK